MGDVFKFFGNIKVLYSLVATGYTGVGARETGMEIITKSILGFKLTKRIFVFVVLIIACISFVQKAECAAEGDLRKIVRIGTIGINTRDESRILLPLVNYLNLHPNLASKYQFETAVAESLEEMTEKLIKGEIMFYIDSPFPVFHVMSSVDLELIGRRWKKGVEQYHSVIFVNKKSNISSIDQLQGKIIQFGEPFSSSSYALPKGDLLARGITFTKLQNQNSSFPKEHVGYVFNTDEEKSFLKVFKSEVLAGATDNITYDNIPQLVKKNLRVLYRTESIPRHLICCSRKADRGMIANFKNVLYSMVDSDEGKDALRSFENTIKFDTIPEEEKLRKYMSDLIKLLREKEDAT